MRRYFRFSNAGGCGKAPKFPNFAVVQRSGAKPRWSRDSYAGMPLKCRLYFLPAGQIFRVRLCAKLPPKSLDILPFDSSQTADCMLPDEPIALVRHRPLPPKAVSRFESPNRAEPSGAQYTLRAAPSVPRGQIHAERIHTT